MICHIEENISCQACFCMQSMSYARISPQTQSILNYSYHKTLKVENDIKNKNKNIKILCDVFLTQLFFVLNF